jgi:predicted small secreted protein
MKRTLSVLDGMIFTFIIAVVFYLHINDKPLEFILIGLGCALLWGIFATRKLWSIKPRSKIRRIQLLNQQEAIVKEWYITDEQGLLIGKSYQSNPVDIDLSETEYAALIEKVHATINFVKGAWYLEDMGSRNGTGVKARNQTGITRLEDDEKVQLQVGDRIYIAKTALQLSK